MEEILKRTTNGFISFCTKCHAYHVEFGNLFFTFTERDDRRVSHEELEWIGEGRERFWRTAPLFPKPASVVCAPSPSRDF